MIQGRPVRVGVLHDGEARMASKEQRGHDALCKLLLEEALVRIAGEEDVQVDRVAWRDLAPDHTGPPPNEREPAKEMKIWSGNRRHFLNLTNEEFQGCSVR